MTKISQSRYLSLIKTTMKSKKEYNNYSDPDSIETRKITINLCHEK